ncbi:MAG: hypothetical protein LC660_15380 [Desulfobacteraceae bacterium]|nr:hypothetical protein [Desulfobacteraceae bacterium]
MNIIVCVKQICYTYARTGKNPDTKYINPEDSIFRINPYDEAATELALRVKETAGNIRSLPDGLYGAQGYRSFFPTGSMGEGKPYLTSCKIP